MVERDDWDKTRIIAEMWWCGDDECDCTQPQILEISPNVQMGRPWIHRKVLWGGEFHSGGEPDVVDAQWEELRQAAARYGATMPER